ncbi:MAG: hypothetical protein HY554_18390 [Elusimicrobia bacterium]|nr:hypothetical protein [Elusimicrobiota bacterium]
MLQTLEKTSVAVEFPQKGEVVASPQYTIRIAAPLDAQRVELSIDSAPFQPCRQAEGRWWFDWTGIEQGYHAALVRVTLSGGFVVSLPTHEMEARLGDEPRQRSPEQASTQLTVVTPDEPGMLARVTQILSREGVDLHGVVTERLGEKTAIRFLAERRDGLRRKLENSGFPVLESQVFHLEIPNQAGELNRLAKMFAEDGINVVALYSTAHGSKAKCVVAVDQPEAAARTIARNGIEVIEQSR